MNSTNFSTANASAERLSATRPLAGIRVIDLTDHRGDVGPWMLAELGADVIKIEPPNGCSTRSLQPIRHDDTSDLRSLHFSTYASNKRSMQLDLDDLSDRETFLRLVETADFLYESGLPCRTCSAA